MVAVHNLLANIVSACARRAGLVVAIGVLIAVLCGAFAVTHLGVTTDVDTLFRPSLAWKQRQIQFAKQFPQLQDLLVVVVDGATPEETELTAAGIARTLAQDTAHFRSVQRPDGLPFFQKEGLLFLPPAELENLLNTTIDAQPFLGQLTADPSLRGLFAALSLVAMGVEQGQANLESFAPELNGFHKALADAASGNPEPLSWERLLAGPLAAQAPPYHFILAQAKLDYGALQPGGAATAAIRAAAERQPAVQNGRARVRITGSVALADEEFATVAEGAVLATIGSLLLVTLWLFLAARTWRVVVPIVLTLFLGLILTTGFAAVAVGTLNLISVAFAVLFVGIAVDFAIQFSVRFREMRLYGPDLTWALGRTARRAGVQVLVASTATAAGFLAFVPTDFLGVSELGLIAGGGMLIAFVCTVTFLPAALSLFQPKADIGEIGFRWMQPADAFLTRAAWPVALVFAALGVLGAVLLPSLVFDSDPLHTKNPNTEAMRTLRDLMSNPVTNPYSADILEPSLQQAQALAAKLEKLPLVSRVMTLDSYVPGDQQQKLALVADAANILGPTLAPRAMPAPVTVGDLRLATKTALDQITPVLPKIPADSPLAKIAGDLRALQSAPNSTLIAANDALTRFLPMQLDRLREMLTAQPVTVDSLPPELKRDWLLPDGQARVQVLPKEQALRSSKGLIAFVDEIAPIAPNVGGSAETIVATSRTIIKAFSDAAIGALIAIIVILFLALRRVLDVVLVVIPLLLSALLTVVIAALLPFPLNFANIIALPLLLGVGVSFNIYFVMNWRAGHTGPLASATARAVIFSALTTGTAFGSLALSAHPGTASMGELLLMSLGCTLICTLIFEPAMLALLPAPHPDRPPRAPQS